VIVLPITLTDIYLDLVSAEELVELEKVSLQTFGYVTSPQLRRYLRTTRKFAAGAGDSDI